MKWTIGCIVAATAIAGGCGPSPEANPSAAASQSTNPPAAKSTTSLVIDGMTGKTAVDAQKRATATIDRVNKQKQADTAAAGAE